MLSVGEILKKERLKKGYTLAYVEKNIKVRGKFLTAIEENNWSFFTSKIYITGIIKNYARFLGLDYKRMQAFFRREYEKKDDLDFKKKVSSSYLVSDTRKFVTILLSIVSFFFFLYFGYQIYMFVSPPKVVILKPTQSHFKRVEKITIKGKTEKEASVSIFGKRIYLDHEGLFTYELPLKQGVNTMTIEVIGANGKKVNIQRTYIKE
ncbi:MAG: helix-turn-helix transcriptional regulator [Patescibacteria group bacterium]